MLLRMSVSTQTLCYVFRPGEGGRQQVLLGRKKRGFGAGMIMGLGGKAGPGESEAACAVREAGEEAGDGPGVVRRRRAAAGPDVWDDEAYWLPRVMAGETLAGVITYDGARKLVARAELTAASAPGPRRYATPRIRRA
jgi:hypothetical protein